MILVPRRYCLDCDTLLATSGACATCDNAPKELPCLATNKAGDVCAEPAGHCYPHRTAEGRDFYAEQSDAEIGALVRAAFARHHDQPGCFVELESVEAVEVTAVFGPGVVEIEAVKLRVTSRAKLKVGS